MATGKEKPAHQAGFDAIMPEFCRRYKRVRSGLAVGFPDSSAMEAFREARGGVWMDVGADAELPFEDAQFEVVVVATDAVSRAIVREVNRVLIYGGSMFFTVREKTGPDIGYTPPEIYRLVREGFDILSVRRPKWWHFGARAHTITVCARKKAWREHKGLHRGGTILFTPLRARVNHGMPGE